MLEDVPQKAAGSAGVWGWQWGRCPGAWGGSGSLYLGGVWSVSLADGGGRVRGSLLPGRHLSGGCWGQGQAPEPPAAPREGPRRASGGPREPSALQTPAWVRLAAATPGRRHNIPEAELARGLAGPSPGLQVPLNPGEQGGSEGTVGASADGPGDGAQRHWTGQRQLGAGHQLSKVGLSPDPEAAGGGHLGLLQGLAWPSARPVPVAPGAGEQEGSQQV